MTSTQVVFVRDLRFYQSSAFLPTPIFSVSFAKRKLKRRLWRVWPPGAGCCRVDSKVVTGVKTWLISYECERIRADCYKSAQRTDGSGWQKRPLALHLKHGAIHHLEEKKKKKNRGNEAVTVLRQQALMWKCSACASKQPVWLLKQRDKSQTRRQIITFRSNQSQVWDEVTWQCPSDWP